MDSFVDKHGETSLFIFKLGQSDGTAYLILREVAERLFFYGS